MKYLLLALFLPSCTTTLSYTDEKGRSFGGGVTLNKTTGYAK